MQSKYLVLPHLSQHDLKDLLRKAITGNANLIIVEQLKGRDFFNEVVRSSFFGIGYCREGTARFVLNGRERQVSSGQLFLYFGGLLIEGATFSDDFQAIGAFHNLSFLQDTLVAFHHLWGNIVYFLEHPVQPLSHPEQQRLWLDFRWLVRRIKDADHPYQDLLVRNALQGFYLDLCGIVAQQYTPEVESHSRVYGIFSEFMELLAQHYAQQREVSWYAQQLQISPKYLSEIAKAASGRNASYWINLLVLLEVKSLLLNTTLSIKEIAHRMNFASQSVLGRYFRNIAGLSPDEFRRQSLR